MARLTTYRETVTTTNIVTTSTSTPFKVSRAKTLAVQAIVDVNTPAAKTFTVLSQVDETLTVTAHGFTTGLKGQATNAGGALPTGIVALTDYFVVVVDADTIKLSDTLAHALAGTNFINISGNGTGTQTFTPTAVAGATVTLLKSNNYNPITGTGSFDPVEAATAITADADIWISDVDPEYEYAQLSYTLTAGRLSAASYIVLKEDV